MNGELMVVAIVLIIAVSRIMQARYGAARGRDRDQARAPYDDGESDRLRGEVRQLKDRIQVLEAIVTDGDRNRSIALEREIEALRDPAPRADREGAK